MSTLQQQMTSLALAFGTVRFGVADIHHNIDGHLPSYEQRTRSELLMLMHEAVNAGFAVKAEPYEMWNLTPACLALGKVRT